MDEHLDRLIVEICCHPPGSLERQRGLNRLIGQIQKSGKLLRGDGVPDREDALQQTWLYFCRNLCEATTGKAYDSTRASVITWLNAYLERRLQDSRSHTIAKRKLTVEPSLSTTGEYLDPLEQFPAPTQPLPILEEICTWVKQECHTLKRIHVRDRPDINCYSLMLRRLPPETPWEDLATEFSVAIATLSNFYQRECRPRLKAFILSQGYFDP